MLDPRRRPFWEFSERILFLARRDSETVGRIAGIIDRHYNEFHDEKMGIWGFFECADDQEAAAALFSSVATLSRSIVFTPNYSTELCPSARSGDGFCSLDSSVSPDSRRSNCASISASNFSWTA
jgi:hypothetical protein